MAVVCKCHQRIFFIAGIFFFISQPFFPKSEVFASTSAPVSAANLRCEFRCGSPYNRSNQCQCNDRCDEFGNCCQDYHQACVETAQTCTPFAQLTQELWDLDVDRLSGPDDLVVDFQARVPDRHRQDESARRFFSLVNEDRLNLSQVYRSFLDLLDNYDPQPKVAENETREETQEQDAFLRAVLETAIFKELLDYLKCRNFVKDGQDFEEKLRRMWFELYPRSGKSLIPDTSGFEHVFVGEFKNSATVSGFHSWVTFYRREKEGSLDYYGYVGRERNIAVGLAFNWDGRIKTLGSFFLGTSPAYDLAVASVCYLTLSNRQCDVTVDGHVLHVKTYKAKGHVATMYVEINVSEEDIQLTNATASCKGRCGAPYNQSDECHCNGYCKTYGDCCEDYQLFCAEETRTVKEGSGNGAIALQSLTFTFTFMSFACILFHQMYFRSQVHDLSMSSRPYRGI